MTRQRCAQVVSDYLTAYDDEMKFLRSQGKPVAIYTYQMAFVRRTL